MGNEDGPRARRRMLAAATGSGVGLLLAPGIATGAEFVVDSLADGAADDTCGVVQGDCTLRDAIDLANDTANASSATADNDRITFASGLSGSIDVSSVGRINILEQLTIEGPGADVLAIDGGGSTGILNFINAGARSYLSDLTLSNADEGPFGVALNLNDSTLTAEGLTLTGNRLGGIGSGGAAIRADSSFLDISDSVISDNGIVGAFADGGAILATLSTLTITDSEITGNEATGSGRTAGGMLINSSSLRLERSLVSGNEAAAAGGGLRIGNNSYAVIIDSTIAGNTTTGESAGSGLSATGNALVLMLNSTVSGNDSTAHPEGGAAVAITAGAELIASESTIAGNLAASRAGGVELDDADSSFTDTIIGDNSAGSSPRDLFSANSVGDDSFTLTRSIAENTVGATISDGGENILGVDPVLGPLGDNGGPTPTMVPGGGSPAVDAGGSIEATDQRGISRPQGEAPDIGAVEVRQVAASISSGPPSVSNDPTPTFGFTSAQDTSGFRCRIDPVQAAGAAQLAVGSFSGCSSPYTPAALADGDFTFAVQALSVDGYPSDSEQLSFTVDTVVTDPDVTAKKKQTQKGRKVKIKLKGGAAEAVSGVAKGKIKVKKARRSGAVSAKSFPLKKVKKSTGAGKQTVYRLQPKRKKDVKKILRLLKRGADLRANPSLKLTDEVGNSASERRVVRLKAKR